MKPTLKDAVLRGDIRAMKEAIAFGADPNEVDGSMTPLLWAIMGGRLEAVELLLKKGADPNLRPSGGDSPLWSAEDDFGLTAIAGRLRAYGAKK